MHGTCIKIKYNYNKTHPIPYRTFRSSLSIINQQVWLWLRWFIGSLSSPRPEFDPMSVHNQENLLPWRLKLNCITFKVPVPTAQ